MSSAETSNESKENGNEEEKDEQLFLFDMKSSKKPEYWTFIKLIAPDNTKKKWKSSECLGAYCTKCALRLTYTPSNPTSIPRHMNQKHANELLEFAEAKRKEKKRKHGTMFSHFHSVPQKKTKMASNANQKHMELVAAMWTATSLRPFMAIEDHFLKVMIDFASATDGNFNLPSRNLNRANVMKLGEWMANEIKDQIRREMDFFSTTTDLWSSRKMTALMALTLHYLTDDFQMREA